VEKEYYVDTGQERFASVVKNTKCLFEAKPEKRPIAWKNRRYWKKAQLLFILRNFDL